MTVAASILSGHVRSIQEMDERVFTRFFREHFPLLTHFANRMTGQRQEAEEIAADAFFRLWERRNNYPHPLVMKAFVYTAVRFACLNFRRDKHREARRMKRFSYQLPETEGTVLDAMTYAETCREAMAAVSQLPYRCRQVAESLFLNGQSPAEAALVLGISASTVRNQKARAVLLMRRQFGYTGNFPVDPERIFPEL